ncbi:voltage-gated chloride channel [Flagelloscypha sp. PMI_526]|nr:voltage-gated chloride channel [Flagelloscypha sp. PMI_526]
MSVPPERRQSLPRSAGPATTSERRSRLLRIGSSGPFDTVSNSRQATSLVDVPSESPTTPTPRDRLPGHEGTPLLRTQSYDVNNYGSSTSTLQKTYSSFTGRRGFKGFSLRMPRQVPSGPSSPVFGSGSLRGFAYSRLAAQRPISTYDASYLAQDLEREDALDAKINGMRVWYSSFTGDIDWLHDAIKDSLRFTRLRRRKSWRAKFRLVLDKSLGWVIVTIVGVLTALIAYLIIRAEKWLFDLKEGYCGTHWWMAKSFCCHPQPALWTIQRTSAIAIEENCEAWHNWAEVFSAGDGRLGTWVEYLSYTVLALTLATTSAILTIYLTNSNTFITRKESGVLAPDFQSLPTRETAPPKRTMYYAAGSGIPEIKTILSGFVIHGYLGGRTLFTKSVGLALSVASGLSLGKEGNRLGPFVHIASCVGNIVSRFSPKYELNEAKRREILSAACAAGVAVAFGAPIGGTLFSLEEVSYYFPPKVMWRSFFCAMIAAMTLRFLDPFGTGKLVLFQVTYDKDWHAYELLPFLFLGIFGGVFGAYFSKLNFRWSKHVRNKTWLKSHPILEVLLITLLTACLCFLNPYTRMGGTELVYNLFSECRVGETSHEGLCLVDPGSSSQAKNVIQAIAIAMVVKGALTVITFGIKLPAGIFIPSLGVGACAGRIMGILVQYNRYHHPDSRFFAACGGDLNCVIPGLYAMVGAAATLSGVTRTTVSLAVIMFELTDSLTYVVPIMLSVLVAKTVADALEPKGIYDLVIELAQLPYLDSKAEYLWGSFQISDVTVHDVQTIRTDQRNTVMSLRDLLVQHLSAGMDDSGFPILKADERNGGLKLVGYIGSNELEHALSVVADQCEEDVHFHAKLNHITMASTSVSSLMESAMPGDDPLDFSVYMDSAPLTISSNSPLELLMQFFTKLGARYVVINDSEGYYEGVIDKKTWLAFLSELEEK